MFSFFTKQIQHIKITVVLLMPLEYKINICQSVTISSLKRISMLSVPEPYRTYCQQFLVEFTVLNQSLLIIETHSHYITITFTHAWSIWLSDYIKAAPVQRGSLLHLNIISVCVLVWVLGYWMCHIEINWLQMCLGKSATFVHHL